MLSRIILGMLGGFFLGMATALVVGCAGYLGTSLIGGEWEPFSTYRLITGYSMYCFASLGAIAGALWASVFCAARSK